MIPALLLLPFLQEKLGNVRGRVIEPYGKTDAFQAACTV